MKICSCFSHLTLACIWRAAAWTARPYHLQQLRLDETSPQCPQSTHREPHRALTATPVNGITATPVVAVATEAAR